MSLLERLAKDLKEAIRSRDEPRKSAIRMITWAAKNAQVEKGDPLSDGELVTLIAKEVRHCQESIAGFNKGGRDDLAAKEQAELEVLQSYMPPQMSQDEIAEEACKIIAEVGARGIADKGKVMPVLISQAAGRAQGHEINKVVTKLLAELDEGS